MHVPDDRVLERLRAGAGCVVRELLTRPRQQARRALLACLCTRDRDGWLESHREGYVELMLAHRPRLDDWFEWIRTLPDTLEDHELRYPFGTLRLAATSGITPCAEFLQSMLHNNHMRTAAFFAYCDGREPHLSDEDWQRVLPRLSKRQLSWVVEDDDAWRSRAERFPPIAAALASLRQRRVDAARAGCRTPPIAAGDTLERSDPPWSRTDYEAATYSSRRYQALRRALRDRPPELRELLFDGLYDAAARYRQHCIDHVDLDDPGVRARLEQLATLQLDTAERARARLDGDQFPATT